MKTIEVAKTTSSGIAIAKVYKVETVELVPSTYRISNVEDEIQKYKEAVQFVSAKIETLAKDNEIFAAHLELVNDVGLMEGVINKITMNEDNAELALDKTAQEFIMIFESMDNEYMRERVADINDIRNRLMTHLKGLKERDFGDLNEEAILVTKDLAPSDTAKLDLKYIKGFITELGGVTSHVSIMAKNMGLPALVGVQGIMEIIDDEDQIIMDAQKGIIIINPDEETRKHYQELEHKEQQEKELLEKIANLPAETKDGRKVKVCANVGCIEDVKNAVTKYIDGIGLFRSEFLYMENTQFPTEEEQFEAYKEAARLCEGEVIIRTLDIGGDKALPYYPFEQEENPFLGWRAIRISLEKQDLFKTQLRALLRASAFGEIWIMYPMIVSLEELHSAKALLETCKKELLQEGKAYDEHVKVGMMIETPASVMCVEAFAEEVDFFSIGTNDLTQYLLAVDRGNQHISSMYNSFHPAVMRAIAKVIKAGHKAGIPVGMCGEFASDIKAVPVLLGMGLDEYSVCAGEVAKIKAAIRQWDYKACEELAEKVIRAKGLNEVMALIEDVK
ncbi:phosphoenolpyruvate--protein phosphotransferase [Sporanaerobium hydrogeniformans]|uniref:Phosphoenolpyruvate--protein phosphotransferase n=1 Tax=Sporanaerobium hydrogeniformans TaxID=3072179 RepID=A0AC61D7Z2_9FIRM|nr:phosphoenolpyruvate--protein phosphotransferase [Sporanaerobium hydrogeniformans]PHV69649.1 phosphoenolpyruvate--protein phosphotransferase [Sporanaerobium hydrogeniformans]